MAEVFEFYQLDGPENLGRYPDPDGIGPETQPGSGQILCRTEVTAVSPGTELAAWRGDAPLRPTPNPYPRLMGYCNVARVLAVGTDVPKGLVPGARVVTHQSHRSGFAVDAGAVLDLVPEDLDSGPASVMYLFHLGYSAFLKSGAVQGDRVAVVGLGTLGLTASAVFANAGTDVTAYSNHDPGTDLLAAFGVTALAAKGPEVMDEGRFDHVILTTNGWDDWLLALRLCRVGAVITVIGFPGRDQPPPEFNPLQSAFFYDKQLTFRACGQVPRVDAPRQDLPHTLKQNCAFLMRAIAQGRLAAAALIGDRRPATQLSAVYADMQAGRRSAQTVLLDWS